MGFFSLRNQHMLFLLILIPIVGVVVVYEYYPEYTTNSAEVALAIVIAIPLVMWANAKLNTPNFPHIEKTVWHWKTLNPHRPIDYYIETEPEAGGDVPEVYSLCEQDEKGNDIPLYFGMRYWYPYLYFTHWPVDVWDYYDAIMHVTILPHPWHVFMKFVRRVEAAYLQGETVDHGASVHLDTILAPFKMDYLGKEIPVDIGVLSTYTIMRIVRDWKYYESELARYLVDMPALIQQLKDEIFPLKSLEQTAKPLIDAMLKKEKGRLEEPMVAQYRKRKVR